MENLDTDLKAVLKLVGMSAQYKNITTGIGQLRRAHQSAGAQLQRKLRESIAGMDLGEVFRKGNLEVKHADGPAKTIYLVEDRGIEEEVPEEWEGEVREIDD